MVDHLPGFIILQAWFDFVDGKLHVLLLQGVWHFFNSGESKYRRAEDGTLDADPLCEWVFVGLRVRDCIAGHFRPAAMLSSFPEFGREVLYF
jgi:hypothetical protein